jgi:hypothetical protein
MGVREGGDSTDLQLSSLVGSDLPVDAIARVRTIARSLGVDGVRKV